VASNKDWLDQLEEMLTTTKLTTSHWPLATHPAIGEIGLDRYISPRDDALQESVFRDQLRLATRLGKPVMLHTRHSLDRVLEILSEKFVEIPVFLLHGFGSSTERVDKIANMGGYFSFSANILKNHYKKMRYAAATVPLDRVLLESDAPDMPPPHLYPRNEPAVLPAVLDELARLRGMPIGELAAVIAENEAAFFKKW
jgi:TatD DNase family protein